MDNNITTTGMPLTAKPEDLNLEINGKYEHKTLDEKVVGDDAYEFVNHPSHYNDYDTEVIDMINRIWGPEETAIWCKITAFKYRMRMGNKPGESINRDLEKERKYLDWYRFYSGVCRNKLAEEGF